MDVPITVRPDAAMPIYLQIAYQLRYLITSGRMPEGTRLPTVRATAERLQVNPSTVAQAYRDLHEQGLIEAAPGRGTFVSPSLPTDADVPLRRRQLAEALERALLRGAALGFGPEEVGQAFDDVVAAVHAPRTILFAAPSIRVGRKYASSLERRFGTEIAVHPVTFGELEDRAPHVGTLLQTAYFVATFAGHARAVEESLARFGAPSRVLPCTTEVQPFSIQELEALPAGSRLCLVTQEPYVAPTLNLIEKRTSVPASEVTVCLDGDAATAATAFPAADRVLYTFLARDFVVEQGVEVPRRLEVAFDLTHASVERLREVIGLTSAEEDPEEERRDASLAFG